MYKQLITLCLAVILVSCNFFSNKESNVVLEEIDTVINFNRVDAYPLFPSCSEIPSREKQKICFQLKMSEHIYNALRNNSLTSNGSFNDTIFLKLRVNTKGKTVFYKNKKTKNIITHLPKIDSVIQESLKLLPVLKPAIKRNMLVTTEFTLPIVIKN